MSTFAIHGARGTHPVSGPDFARYSNHTTCFSLSTDEGLFIIDAGTGLASLGAALARRATLPPMTFIFTHLHLDHTSSLSSFLPLQRRDARITIMADSRVLPGWQRALAQLIGPPFWPVGLTECPATVHFEDLAAHPEPGSIKQYGIRMRWCPVQHPQGCISYRFETETGAIVIATDRECGEPRLDALFLEFCLGAAMLIHDAQFMPAELPSRRGWGHSSWEQAARVAAEAGVGQLILASHDPTRTDETIDAIVQETRRVFPHTEAASQRLEYGVAAAAMTCSTTPATPTVQQAGGPLTFRYEFRFPDGTEQRFAVSLDPQTLLSVSPVPSELPGWTALSHHKCGHCPLPDGPNARCPAAVSLVDVERLFGSAVSFETVHVAIDSPARRYEKQTSLQQAVGSLIGLLMVTSGCPVMGKLRPMVQSHLPFSTMEETKYRAITMYLLAQYFLARHGRTPDWQLEQLARLYDDIHRLNLEFAKRLTDAGDGDAPVNALIILDSFADTISFSIDTALLEELEQLYAPYLQDAPPPSI